jgi:hypothetical protein
MERVTAVITEARAAGLDVRAEADRLVIRGPRIQEHLARQLLDQKPRVLAVLEAEHAEITWRITVMRPQVPARGPIPVLSARAVESAPGCCTSCGDPIIPPHRYRCEPCVRATWTVLREVRNRVEL